MPASPLSDVPGTPPPDLTPRAATKVADEPSPSKQRPSTKKPKDRKQIIDSVIELEEGPGAKIGRNKRSGLGNHVQKDVSGILTEVRLDLGIHEKQIC